MFHLILLAAGSSRRFGEDKLLWLVEGTPMLLRSLNRLTALTRILDADVTVVIHEGAAAGLLKAHPVRVLLNPNHAQGISTSIRCALDALNDGSPAAFFVADQPWLRVETIHDFLNGWLRSGKGAGCVAHCGETGNPAAFTAKYFPELRALEGDRGGKRVLQRHPEDCYLFEVRDARELEDVDVKPERT